MATFVGSSALKISTAWIFLVVTPFVVGIAGFLQICWPRLKVSSFLGRGLAPFPDRVQLGRIRLATDSSVPTRFPWRYIARFIGLFE